MCLRRTKSAIISRDGSVVLEVGLVLSRFFKLTLQVCRMLFPLGMVREKFMLFSRYIRNARYHTGQRCYQCYNTPVSKLTHDRFLHWTLRVCRLESHARRDTVSGFVLQRCFTVELVRFSDMNFRSMVIKRVQKLHLQICIHTLFIRFILSGCITFISETAMTLSLLVRANYQ